MESRQSRFAKDFILNKYLYLFMLPVIAYYVIFHYLPMYGALIAFKHYTPIKGVLGSEWAGFVHFASFFESYYFFTVLKNTVIISLYSICFEFPMPILLAIMINEVRKKFFKKLVQTITYMPYFISTIVVVGMIRDFTNSRGIVNMMYTFVFGGDGQSLLQRPELFRAINVLSDIWQRMGWESIIFLAALMSVDQELYEAAHMDGASRLKQIWHVTLPGIMPIIMILLILRIGNILNVGFEKILLLYSPVTYNVADVISTFVYRRGLLEFNWSFSTAVGLFNSVINLCLLVMANRLSRKWNGNSLW